MVSICFFCFKEFTCVCKEGELCFCETEKEICKQCVKESERNKEYCCICKDTVSKRRLMSIFPAHVNCVRIQELKFESLALWKKIGTLTNRKLIEDNKLLLDKVLPDRCCMCEKIINCQCEVKCLCKSDYKICNRCLYKAKYRDDKKCGICCLDVPGGRKCRNKIVVSFGIARIHFHSICLLARDEEKEREKMWAILHDSFPNK